MNGLLWRVCPSRPIYSDETLARVHDTHCAEGAVYHWRLFKQPAEGCRSLSESFLGGLQ